MRLYRLDMSPCLHSKKGLHPHALLRIAFSWPILCTQNARSRPEDTTRDITRPFTATSLDNDEIWLISYKRRNKQASDTLFGAEERRAEQTSSPNELRVAKMTSLQNEGFLESHCIHFCWSRMRVSRYTLHVLIDHLHPCQLTTKRWLTSRVLREWLIAVTPSRNMTWIMSHGDSLNSSNDRSAYHREGCEVRASVRSHQVLEWLSKYTMSGWMLIKSKDFRLHYRDTVPTVCIFRSSL